MSFHHTITHIEIPAPDLAKAIQFYSTVFNWKIEIIQPGAYAFFIIGGGLDASLKPAEEKCGPQLVIDVEDIPATLDKIKQEGGIITLPKTEIPGGHGFFASFQDPNKNHLQVHSRS
jgi:uncharacterized protein